MLIAVAAAGERVPARFEEADTLLLIETDTDAVTALPRGGEAAADFAARASESGAEAVCCGMIGDEAVFDALANLGVTRCFAAGREAVAAAHAAEEGTLPLIVRPGVLH